MKMVIDVSNPSTLLRPKEGNVSVLLHDGGKWYVTSKEKLLADVDKTLSDCQALLASTKAENEAFKAEIAKQMVEISSLIKTLYENKGEQK